MYDHSRGGIYRPFLGLREGGYHVWTPHRLYPGQMVYVYRPIDSDPILAANPVVRRAFVQVMTGGFCWEEESDICVATYDRARKERRPASPTQSGLSQSHDVANTELWHTFTTPEDPMDVTDDKLYPPPDYDLTPGDLLMKDLLSQQSNVDVVSGRQGVPAVPHGHMVIQGLHRDAWNRGIEEDEDEDEEQPKPKRTQEGCLERKLSVLALGPKSTQNCMPDHNELGFAPPRETGFPDIPEAPISPAFLPGIFLQDLG